MRVGVKDLKYGKAKLELCDIGQMPEAKSFV